MVDVSAETRCTLAVENHQLNQALRNTDRVLILGNCPLGAGNRCSLSPKYVRPKPSINGLLVRLQGVLAQPQAGMKERLIALICGVEILEHTQQGSTVKSCQPAFHVRPTR